MFKVTRNIRVLHIDSYFVLEVMTENIGYLHHLRYLRFPGYSGELLPRSLSTMYHLQFITVGRGGSMKDDNDYFPRDMNNLSNLRYLRSRRLNFPGIGKLKFLQEVEKFCIKNEDGYRIEELKHMNDLHFLKLINLKDVRDAEEAYNAKLCDKRKLTYLSLSWKQAEERDNPDLDLDERVLDNLQPHNYLQTLHIFNYMGTRSAKWMNEAHLINNLEEIELSDCLEWEILPPFGQLPFLKTLKLRKMPKVKRLENKFHGSDMCCVFPSLQMLCFSNLEALADWFDASLIDGLFPCLTILKLTNCPNSKELPSLPPKLESLEIENVGWKTLNCCCSISKSIPLHKLLVRHCQNITSISLAGEIDKLENMTIEDLQSLQSLLPSSLANNSSLKTIEVKMLPLLRELPDLPSSLKKLQIRQCNLELVNRHAQFSI